MSFAVISTDKGVRQHLGGPSASGAAIEGTDLGNNTGFSEMKSDLVAFQNSLETSIHTSVTLLKTHIEPVISNTSTATKKLTLQDNQ